MNDKTEVQESPIVFYRSPLAILPAVFLFIICVVIGLYFTVKYPGSIQFVSVGELWGVNLTVGIPLFGIVPLVLIVYVFHYLYDCRYTIGVNSVRSVRGILSIEKSDVRVDYDDMRGIELERGLYGRIFNVGTILVGSSMHSGREIVMDGVRDPSFYRDLILEHRRKRAQGLTEKFHNAGVLLPGISGKEP